MRKKLGEERYVLHATNLTWTSARDHCRKYHTDLASVRNEAESQIIQKVAQDRTVWVGLFRDRWTWSDGFYSSFRYWRPSEKVFVRESENYCAAVLRSESGKWGAQPCGEVYPFICNVRVMRRIIKVRIRSQDSELEQNNPAVEEDLLQQIRQQLGGTIGTENFRLRWKKYPDGRVFVKEKENEQMTDESDAD
ncbi:hypothetical protein INR49_010183 [Caranx melampygus]|nr:hypothetical protein INR49_010183 [Caranx melampygus]